MRKIFSLVSLIVFVLGLAFGSLSFFERQAVSAFKEPAQETILFGKRCEKCKRGPDGKMECVEVPCPK